MPATVDARLRSSARAFAAALEKRDAFEALTWRANRGGRLLRGGRRVRRARAIGRLDRCRARATGSSLCAGCGQCIGRLGRVARVRACRRLAVALPITFAGLWLRLGHYAQQQALEEPVEAEEAHAWLG